MRSDKETSRYNNEFMGKFGKMLEHDGLYVALFVCFCVVAIAAVFTVRTNLENVGNNSDYNRTVKLSENINDVTNQVVNKAINTEVAKEEKSLKQDEGKVVNSNSDYLRPVEGNIINGYSVDIPVYSKTLDQFVTHVGIDIEAPLDEPVIAVQGGIVTKVYNDDKLGITIMVKHDDGMVAKYCNLSTDQMVQEGDAVKAGDVISGVGNTALFESMEASHLHFELLKDDINVDPCDYINY